MEKAPSHDLFGAFHFILAHHLRPSKSNASTDAIFTIFHRANFSRIDDNYTLIERVQID